MFDECFDNIKNISIYSNNGINKLDVLINEFFTKEMKNMFIWPSALVLSSYIASNHQIFKDKSIIEISAGVGLPSIVAAKVGARNCIITEQGIDKDNLILENLRKNVTSNSVDHICDVISLQWGIITEVPYCDIILGSDLFYSTESFSDILTTVASLMIINQNIIFLTTYQERSVSRSLLPFLDNYNLKGNIIPLSTFFSAAHEKGFCKLEGHLDSTIVFEKEIDLLSFDDIYLIEIKLKSELDII